MADTRYITRTAWTGLTPTETTYPDGRKVTSGYDALYRRNSVNETSGGASIAAWEFFGNRSATVALGNGITQSFMNNAGTNSAVQSGVPLPAWGDKTTDRLGYDGSGRMIAKRFLPSGSTTALVGSTTAYDPSSNKQFERALQGDESRSALYPGYDSMNRLLQYQRGVLASGGGSVATPIALPGTDSNRAYNLDGLGNWKNTVYTPEGGSPTTEIRQHNKLNEITQFATTPVLYDHGNNTATSYPNRGNGNIANDGTRIYAYDALNRLTTVSSTAGGTPQVATYTYDALGRRIQKIVQHGGIPGSIANATYRYLYDGQQIIEELLVTSGPTYSTLRQFIWGQYIDELIQLTVASSSLPFTAGTYYPLQDLLYRTTASTNNGGSIVEAYDYDAYGNTLAFYLPGGSGWFSNDDTPTFQPMCEFLFTGRQYDPETEIYWYRARYYNTVLGRFLSRDPIIDEAVLSLYLAFLSAPILRLDPTGAAPMTNDECCRKYYETSHDSNPGQGVCCCGKVIPCSVPDVFKDFFKDYKNAGPAFDAMAKCAKMHEQRHIDDQNYDCTNIPDGKGAHQPHPDKNKDECRAYTAEIICFKNLKDICPQGATNCEKALAERWRRINWFKQHYCSAEGGPDVPPPPEKFPGPPWPYQP